MPKRMPVKLEISLTDKPHKATERPHPIRKVPGTGRAVWAAEIGRWVVYARA